MIKKISILLRDKIKDINGISKISGAVFTQRLTIGSVLKSIPVSESSLVLNCEEQGNNLIKMIPDSNVMSLAYFEGVSTKPTKNEYSSGYSYKSVVRFVWWGDIKKLGQANNDLCLPDLIQAKVLEAFLSVQNETVDYLGNINVKVLEIPTSTKEIFSKYDYQDVYTNYLYPPYYYFAIDLEVSYIISQKCFNIDIPLSYPLEC